MTLLNQIYSLLYMYSKGRIFLVLILINPLVNIINVGCRLIISTFRTGAQIHPKKIDI